MKGELEIITIGTRTTWIQIRGGEAVSNEFPNGKVFRWDSKVNPDTLEFITADEPEYASCERLTANELDEQGKMFRCSIGYNIMPKNYHNTPQEIKAIREEFRKHGFDISGLAIRHNYEAWKADKKSGYRGATTHLFTPCGCNPLRFYATYLFDYDKDWQTTYEI